MLFRLCIVARSLSVALALVGSFAACFSRQAAAQDRRGPFTHAPRSVRSRTFDALHLRLELAPDWERRELHGVAIHTLAPFSPARQVEFDAAGMTVRRVRILNGPDGQPGAELAFDQKPDRVTIALDREYAAQQEVRLSVEYAVLRPELGAHFVTPDAHEPAKHRVLWTQSEPEYARHWFPCYDAPNERLTSETLVTVPSGMFVLSNGVLFDKQDRDSGLTTWHWKQEQSHAPYLISVVAGDFAAYERSWDGLPVVSYVPPERLADAERSFGKTPGMMQLFSDKLGRYPWPKYAQICCDEYGGGMEHTSATTLGVNTLHDERAHLDVSSDTLVAHELAHQWFGDLVTCKDWAEIWLNESFATYLASVWAEHDLGWDEAAWQRQREAASYLGEDGNAYRRPIVTYRYPNPIDMFDGHSYPKGARVLHMLRYVLGDEMFWKSLRRFLEKHRFSVVETADLRAAIEETTGQGLNWFFDEWLYHGGHPDFQVSYEWVEAEKEVRLVVRQTQKVDDLTPLFRMPIEIELVLPDKTLVEKIVVSQAEETFHFRVDQRPRRVLFDPRDWVLKTLKFDKSKQELLDQLAHDPHVMPRVQAAEGLAKLKGDADVAAALLTAARQDPFWAVRQRAVELAAPFGGDEMRTALAAIAKEDARSAVRRAAVQALGGLTHDESKAALRHAIANDLSYYVVADALRALVKVDREQVEPDLLAATRIASHHETVLAAACEGLVEIKSAGAKAPLLALLQPPATAERRMAVMGAMARLGRTDAEVVDFLTEQLDDNRDQVRQAAARALAETGSPRALEALKARRALGIDGRRVVQALDESIKKLLGTNDVDRLRHDLQSLQEENRKLEERVKQLEQKQ